MAAGGGPAAPTEADIPLGPGEQLMSPEQLTYMPEAAEGAAAETPAPAATESGAAGPAQDPAAEAAAAAAAAAEARAERQPHP